MHIGVNGRTFSTTEPRGSVKATISLVQATNELVDRPMTILTHESAKRHFGDGYDFETSWFPSRSQLYGLAFELTALPLALRRTDLDVLFCPNANGPIVDVDVPVVVHFHDLFGYLGYQTQAYSYLQRAKLPRIVSHADAITTVSGYTKEHLEREFSPSADIHVVANGIDSVFDSDPIDCALDIPDRYALFVGGDEPRKNLSTAIEAVARLRDSGEDVRLVVAGAKSRRFAGSTSNEEPDFVESVGFVSDTELKYLYQNASVFLFPSFREGFGIPPLEAMRCGTPVVAAEIQPTVDLLDDVPVYVDPEDPASVTEGLRTVLHNDALRSEMILRGKEHASTYTWRHSAETLLDVIRGLVKDPPADD